MPIKFFEKQEEIMSVILWILGWLLIGYVSVILANKFMWQLVDCPTLGFCILMTLAGPASTIVLIIIGIEDGHIKSNIVTKILSKIYFLKDKENKRNGEEKGLECDQICDKTGGH